VRILKKIWGYLVLVWDYLVLVGCAMILAAFLSAALMEAIHQDEEHAP